MRCQRKTSRWSSLLTAVIVVLLGSSVGAAPDQPSLPWKTLEDEAVSLLSRYIQIDTTNPPGNEIKAAQFFKEIFDREGIEARIIESAPGRGNIYARLKGTGAKKAVLLLNHMDVVPAEAQLWKEPPFSGVVKERMILGARFVRYKGAGDHGLMSLLALRRQQRPVERRCYLSRYCGRGSRAARWELAFWLKSIRICSKTWAWC